jgi:hypothetical protein
MMVVGGEGRGRGRDERGQGADEDEDEAGAHRRARLDPTADGARQPAGAWNITEAAEVGVCSSASARARTSGAVALTGADSA